MVKKYTIQAVSSRSKFRSIASQSVACMSPYILLLDLGMAISFGTITVPVLLNASQGISLNNVQASWFGSLVYLSQPIGALFSGPLVDLCGRKRGSLLSNIPHLIAWTLAYFAWDVTSLFVASALLGLGTGLMEAPISSYISEVTEPSIRGLMATLTQAWASVGLFLMYFLGTVVDWRIAALISLIFPISSMLLVLVTPETPIWLLSREREKEALRSLCYLRGWTTPDNVKEEFEALKDYTKTVKLCVICSSTNEAKEKVNNINCEHESMNFISRSLLKFRHTMLCRETLRPFLLVALYFTFLTMSGLYPVRPNMVNVCDAFGMADDGNRVAVWVGVLTLASSLLVAAVIRLVGKRKVAIAAMFGCFVSSAALSLYAKRNLSDDVFSYSTDTFPKTKSYFPLVLFYALTVFTGFGIPWPLLGEVFPFKSRGTAQGFAAAWNYVITFIASKTFIDLEISLHLWGAFAVYAAFALVGTLYLYVWLPETEGKTLREVEEYFNGDRHRTFADDVFINSIKKLKR